MTNQGPNDNDGVERSPLGDSSAWSRPGDSGDPRPLPPQNPVDGPDLSKQPPPPLPPTREDMPVQDYPDYPAYPAATGQAPPPYGTPPPPPYGAPVGDVPGYGDSPVAEAGRKRSIFDPLSIVLIFVIVVALVAAGLVGAEMWARNRAESVVAGVIDCVIEDDDPNTVPDVSFGARPFLLQHLTKHYDSISITTSGNNFRDARGMKLQLQIDDIELEDTPDSRGTIGSLQADVTWSTDGITQTLQNIPGVGNLVTGVTTNKADGTIEISADFFFLSGTIVAKPQVVNNQIQIDVVSLNSSGFSLPSESAQPIVDAVTGSMTTDYPLGIQPESVEVTDEGVVSRLSAQNATIPPSSGNPCFEAL